MLPRRPARPVRRGWWPASGWGDALGPGEAGGAALQFPGEDGAREDRGEVRGPADRELGDDAGRVVEADRGAPVAAVRGALAPPVGLRGAPAGAVGPQQQPRDDGDVHAPHDQGAPLKPQHGTPRAGRSRADRRVRGERGHTAAPLMFVRRPSSAYAAARASAVRARSTGRRRELDRPEVAGGPDVVPRAAEEVPGRVGHPGRHRERGQRAAEGNSGEGAGGEGEDDQGDGERAGRDEDAVPGPVGDQDVLAGGPDPGEEEPQQGGAGDEGQGRRGELGGQPAGRGDGLGPGQPGGAVLQFAADERGARPRGDGYGDVTEHLAKEVHDVVDVGEDEVRGGVVLPRGGCPEQVHPQQAARSQQLEHTPHDQRRPVQPQGGAARAGGGAQGQGGHTAAALRAGAVGPVRRRRRRNAATVRAAVTARMIAVAVNWRGQ